jgi:ribose 5-phosphate isomerase B
MKRQLITEQDVLAAAAQGRTQLAIALRAIVTPLAADTAVEKKISLVRTDAVLPIPSTNPSSSTPAAQVNLPSVVIGSDHGGFALKAELVEFMRGLGVRVEDAGATNTEPCDYPDFAHAVAVRVAGGGAGLGIMIDGAGVGSCMVVNKVPGVRGACCTNEFMARNAREHNNANVLTLGSRVIGSEVAKGIVSVFLRTAFAGGRHEARVKKIMDVERRYRK